MTYAEVSFADRRRHSRIEMFGLPQAAISERGDNLSVCGQILDISLGGARVRVDSGIYGQRGNVEVLIEGVKVVAEIVWRSATEIGLRFAEQAGDASVRIFEQILNRQFGRKYSAAS
ncbi:MAG: PilZ domain-containing protein [Minwuia sp.]|uniref:PilZ domain-containing protein n=1 Tax=Minwuia sp. TaxID=2493630 RepID=UPI003A8BE90A